MKLLQIQHQCLVSPEFHYNRPNGLDEYVLILAHGQAYFHANGEKYLLKPNQMFIYDKRQPQLFYSTGEPFRHDWFHFDMNRADVELCTKLEIPFGRPLILSNPFVFSELIRTMASEHRFKQPHSQEIIEQYMRCFFMKLSDMLHQKAEQNADHPYYQCLCQLRNELYSFPYHEWSVEIMAEKAFMSKSWLQHNWKELFNCCYQDDLVHSRVEYAKNLLFHTTNAIEQIAYLCGYHNPTHFMRQFKKMTGLTPSAYRETFAKRDKDVDDMGEFRQEIKYGDYKALSKQKKKEKA